MNWRDITVNGKDYKWMCGRTHINIKGIGIYPCHEVLNVSAETWNTGRKKRTSSIKPHNVADMIQKIERDKFLQEKHHD